MPNFGKRLKLLRLSHEWTTEQLANEAGIHAATVKRIERRGIRPNLATALKLAKALNVQPAILLGLAI